MTQPDTSLSIESLIAEGLYEWDGSKPADDKGRNYLRRTPKGDRALAIWSPDKMQALTSLFKLASES